jgi:hypothetical protein
MKRAMVAMTALVAMAAPALADDKPDTIYHAGNWDVARWHDASCEVTERLPGTRASYSFVHQAGSPEVVLIVRNGAWQSGPTVMRWQIGADVVGEGRPDSFPGNTVSVMVKLTTHDFGEVLMQMASAQSVAFLMDIAGQPKAMEFPIFGAADALNSFTQCALHEVEG